jgi:membrane protein DedA with SNARE-associated domain
MASPIELVGVLVGSFLINLVPFAGPSNLFIASTAALAVQSDPFSLGFLVALGATLAKSVHYVVTFFIGKHIGEKRRERIDAETRKIKRWAFFLLFAAAASPIPDEPVVVPLGLMKYSPAKFFAAFFSGKIIITVIGASLGSWTGEVFSPFISQEVLTVISITLTIVITILLLKVDTARIIEKLFRRKNGPSQKTESKKVNIS